MTGLPRVTFSSLGKENDGAESNLLSVLTSYLGPGPIAGGMLSSPRYCLLILSRVSWPKVQTGAEGSSARGSFPKEVCAKGESRALAIIKLVSCRVFGFFSSSSIFKLFNLLESVIWLGGY